MPEYPWKNKDHERAWTLYRVRARTKNLPVDHTLKPDPDALDAAARTRHRGDKDPRVCTVCDKTVVKWVGRVGAKCICTLCSRRKQIAVRGYTRDAEVRRLVKRSCQGCGSTHDLCWHHVHGSSPSRVQAVLCGPCNLMLGQANDDPSELFARACAMLSIDGADMGDNVYDPALDGPTYIPHHQVMCGPCQKLVPRNKYMRHERTITHIANVEKMSSE